MALLPRVVEARRHSPRSQVGDVGKPAKLAFDEGDNFFGFAKARQDRSEDGRIAPELPSKYLPPVEYRDLPEPDKLRAIKGASVFLLAMRIELSEVML